MSKKLICMLKVLLAAAPVMRSYTGSVDLLTELKTSEFALHRAFFFFVFLARIFQWPHSPDALCPWSFIRREIGF
jgi:hypothetical protein